ncbi:YkuS family protein [Nonomuraea basaltis]|nr:YkuS family protein [Nonomuraea basaltis]
MEPAVLDSLDPLISALRERGYAVVGQWSATA